MKNIIILIIVLMVFSGCNVLPNGYLKGYERGKSEGRLEGISVCNNRLNEFNTRLDAMIESHKE